MQLEVSESEVHKIFQECNVSTVLGDPDSSVGLSYVEFLKASKTMVDLTAERAPKVRVRVRVTARVEIEAKARSLPHS